MLPCMAIPCGSLQFAAKVVFWQSIFVLIGVRRMVDLNDCAECLEERKVFCAPPHKSG
jgi:hypothetical protein